MPKASGPAAASASRKAASSARSWTFVRLRRGRTAPVPDASTNFAPVRAAEMASPSRAAFGSAGSAWYWLLAMTSASRGEGAALAGPTQINSNSTSRTACEKRPAAAFHTEVSTPPPDLDFQPARRRHTRKEKQTQLN